VVHICHGGRHPGAGIGIVAPRKKKNRFVKKAWSSIWKGKGKKESDVLAKARNNLSQKKERDVKGG